jgi:hypothetical protein
LGEVLQTIGGYGFHDDGGARWITRALKPISCPSLAS